MPYLCQLQTQIQIHVGGAGNVASKVAEEAPPYPIRPIRVNRVHLIPFFYPICFLPAT